MLARSKAAQHRRHVRRIKSVDRRIHMALIKGLAAYGMSERHIAPVYGKGSMDNTLLSDGRCQVLVRPGASPGATPGYGLGPKGAIMVMMDHHEIAFAEPEAAAKFAVETYRQCRLARRRK